MKFGLHVSFVELKSAKSGSFGNRFNRVAESINDKNSVFALLDLDLKSGKYVYFTELRSNENWLGGNPPSYWGEWTHGPELTLLISGMRSNNKFQQTKIQYGNELYPKPSEEKSIYLKMRDLEKNTWKATERTKRSSEQRRPSELEMKKAPALCGRALVMVRSGLNHSPEAGLPSHDLFEVLIKSHTKE
ncbi:hypothetical protein TNCV_3414171 [Trichonephila clavipes]|uniref:Uncharacterized protein n=1 Tax=Trichonephila clavipes TaxID=2585209 RepID=A0A8X6RG77_TRICX|nr:hypothetical protein TNCV_3414171 [Trichonephila clavipes]